MAFYIYLQTGRTPLPDQRQTGRDGPDFKLNEFKTPCLAELMLFDETSLVRIDRPSENGGPYFDLISDTESAIERYARRLPLVQVALSSDLIARRSLAAFGQFVAEIDQPYLRLYTGEYRLSFSINEDATFNDEMAFAVSALDQPMVNQSALSHGERQLTPECERVLDFCCSHICGMPFYIPNKWANLLSGHLPRRGALSLPQIQRAKCLLNLSPDQEEAWQSFAAIFRHYSVFPDDYGGEKLKPIDAEQINQMEITLSHHAKPLMASFTAQQQRVGLRLFRAMGLNYRT